MKHFLTQMLCVLFMVGSGALLMADNLTQNYGDTLVNAKIFQFNNSGSLSNKVEIGYYRFDGNGGVRFTGFDVLPSPSYYNTWTSTKHVNSSIRNLYPNSPLNHPLTQVCQPQDMGQMLIPTKQYASRTGTYTFNGTTLEIDIQGVRVWWTPALDSWDSSRWETVDADGSNGTVVNSVKGFAYFSDGLGSYPIDFENDFDQGDLSNSASAYFGHLWTNHQSGRAGNVSHPLHYKGEHKLLGGNFTNESYNGQIVNPDAYGFIYYYDLSNPSARQTARAQNSHTDNAEDTLLDESVGAMVQNSLYLNRYAAFPTMMFGTVGHIYHKAPKRGSESADAYDSRRCWTHSDSIWTQGHLFIHMGAWNQDRISHLVSVEISRNGPYPILSIGYGKGQFR